MPALTVSSSIVGTTMGRTFSTVPYTYLKRGVYYFVICNLWLLNTAMAFDNTKPIWEQYDLLICDLGQFNICSFEQHGEKNEKTGENRNSGECSYSDPKFRNSDRIGERPTNSELGYYEVNFKKDQWIYHRSDKHKNIRKIDGRSFNFIEEKNGHRWNFGNYFLVGFELFSASYNQGSNLLYLKTLSGELPTHVKGTRGTSVRQEYFTCWPID
ncbi:MAG: hypothetical protein VW829_03195 [Deltaproteobacteria bacterium]